VFENLIESKQKGQKTLGQTVLSVLVHAAVIFGAVKATQGVAETINDKPVDTTMVFLKPPEPPPPPPEQPPPDVVVSANPPPKGFQTATGIVGGTGPVNVSGEVFLEAQLDDPVQPISIPTPRYPPVLQSAGIAGSVDLQYVVDTTGHAEANSFKVLKTTHQAFVEPAKEAILKGVFKPAKFKGQPVRQLVQQRISFKVGQ
jgi:periplasmic protein TonB